MNHLSELVLPILFRGSVMMLLAMLLISVLRVHSPKWCRFLCVLALLQGWLLAPWTVEVPWYESISDPVEVLRSNPWNGSSNDLAAVQDSSGQVATSIDKVFLNKYRHLREGSSWLSNAISYIKTFLLLSWIAGMILVVLVVKLHAIRFSRSLKNLVLIDERSERSWRAVQLHRGVANPVP